MPGFGGPWPHVFFEFRLHVSPYQVLIEFFVLQHVWAHRQVMMKSVKYLFPFRYKNLPKSSLVKFHFFQVLFGLLQVHQQLQLALPRQTLLQKFITFCCALTGIHGTERSFGQWFCFLKYWNKRLVAGWKWTAYKRPFNFIDRPVWCILYMTVHFQTFKSSSFTSVGRPLWTFCPGQLKLNVVRRTLPFRIS